MHVIFGERVKTQMDMCNKVKIMLYEVAGNFSEHAMHNEL